MSVYVVLLARPGARALALACAVGWMSFAGLGLGIVLLVEDTTGSFAVAGLAIGGFAAGAGLLAPLRGRRVDRRGGSALVAFGALHAVGLATLVIVAGRAPDAVTVGAAIAAGAVAPPLIATARSLWPGIAGPDLTRAAHAMNALIGDAAAVLAPAVIGGLTVAAGAAAALVVIGGGPLAGCLVVARAGVPATAPAGPAARGGVLRSSRGLRTIVAVGLPLGVTLGALEVAAPALAGAHDRAALAAVPLGAFAAGAVACSAWAGHSARAGGPRTRFTVGTAVMAGGFAPCLLIRSVWVLAAVLVVAGAGFALINVGALELLDDVVDRANAVEALTWLTTAEGIGLAAGGALAGALAADGPGGALVLVALAPVAAVTIAVRRRETLSGG